MILWWYNAPEVLRFRIRFLIFQTIIAVLLVIATGQGVIPWWFVIFGVGAIYIFFIKFLVLYSTEEARFQRNGWDIEGRDIPWQ